MKRNKSQSFADYLTPEIIIQLYKSGIFFMAKDRKDKNVILVDPERRALLPIKNIFYSKSLIRFCKKRPFEITINKSFADVIFNCATIGRTDTWINHLIEKKFIELNKMGFAHSVECWKNNKLVGGIYGISLGSCFFAESMFSKVSNASKFALITLVSRLWKLEYTILDVQFINEHLKQFGVFEISQKKFKQKLSKALEKPKKFDSNCYLERNSFDLLLDFLQDINTKS